MGIPFDFIYTKDALKEAAKEWEQEKVIGVDLECENNLHHFGVYISLIQLSTRSKNWIVDVIALKDIQPLLRVFRNPNVTKIFHDTSFDLRVLNQQFGCRPRNLFDTQLASIFTSREELGLAALLEEFFNVKKERKFQMADWTRRPLTSDMLEYAIKDTVYLIKLKDELTKELKKLGMLEWIEEEFDHIEKLDLQYEDMKFTDIKGAGLLSPKELGILKQLFRVRNQMAKKADRPMHFIMSNARMKELAANPPRKLDDWRSMRGVHPIVKRYANRFAEAVQEGRKREFRFPTPVVKRYSPRQRAQLNYFSKLREEIAEKLGIRSHLILSKDQMHSIVRSGTRDSLRKWQNTLIEKYF